MHFKIKAMFLRLGDMYSSLGEGGGGWWGSFVAKTVTSALEERVLDASPADKYIHQGVYSAYTGHRCNPVIIPGRYPLALGELNDETEQPLGLIFLYEIGQVYSKGLSGVFQQIRSPSPSWLRSQKGRHIEEERITCVCPDIAYINMHMPLFLVRCLIYRLVSVRQYLARAL